MSQLSLVLFVLSIGSMQLSATEEYPGFQLLYQSNPSTFTNERVFFNTPFPPEMKGLSIVYNGLGVFEMGPRQFQHAFDAFAKPISFHFEDENRLTFSFDFLQTNQWRKSNDRNDIAPYLMFESVDPSFGILEKLEAILSGLDNANVNIVSVGDGSQRSFLATSDYWRTWKFEPRNLTTLGKVEPHVPGAILPILSSISTAHPLPDDGTDKLITFTTTAMPAEDLYKGGRLRVIRINSPEDRELITDWKIRKTPYMHSFSATTQYTVIAGAPLTIDVPKMIITIEPFKSLDWRPKERGTMFVVNHKNPTEKYQIPYLDGVFLMHHINAYEREVNDDEKSIVFHATAYRDTDFFKGLEMKRLKDKKLINEIVIDSHIRRYEIFLSNHSISSRVVNPRSDLPFLHHLEMPTINEEYRFKKNCFVYGIVLKSDGVNLANISLVKRSFCNSSDDSFWVSHGHYPAEPKFIPREGRKTEDDGYLVSIVLDGWSGKSYLGIWDARTMDIINRAYLPTFVPYRIHGHTFS